jgi:hypothetical protein
MAVNVRKKMIHERYKIRYYDIFVHVVRKWLRTIERTTASVS